MNAGMNNASGNLAPHLGVKNALDGKACEKHNAYGAEKARAHELPGQDLAKPVGWTICPFRCRFCPASPRLNYISDAIDRDP
jgi:hypothetical protein